VAQGRDDIRTECARVIAGWWFAGVARQGEELVAAGFLMHAGFVDLDELDKWVRVGWERRRGSTVPYGLSNASHVESPAWLSKSLTYKAFSGSARGDARVVTRTHAAIAPVGPRLPEATGQRPNRRLTNTLRLASAEPSLMISPAASTELSSPLQSPDDCQIAKNVASIRPMDARYGP
jgi:hypothetical protein